MAKKIIILGGGVAGMSAAHELVERGFSVAVYEQGAIPGGKARSLGVSDSATEGRKPLPGEHGFRFFPGFYKHLPDTMKRIPYKQNSNGVFDNLVPTTQIGLARFDKPAVVFKADVPWTLDGLKELFRTIFGADVGIPAKESEFFAKRVWQLMTSCAERRLAEYEQLGWWEFLEADGKSAEYIKFFVRGLTRTLVASQAEAASTYTVGNIFLQLFFDIIDPNNDADRLLDGPTNDVWIDPWLGHLQNAGVEYHLNARITGINCDDDKVVSATIEKDGQTFNASGDYYIGALPVEVMAALISEPMIKIDRTLADVRKLGTKVEWMNGLQIYLKRDVEIVHGHLNYVDSPWALTSISQRQFWSEEFDLAQYGDGTVRGIISVDISDWETKGLNGLTAKECTKQQIFEEIWHQLKKSLNVGGAELLRDEDVHSYHLDPDIVFENGPNDPNPEKKRNTEPLLVNLVNTWGMRPEAYTRIPNLFLASDYVRTNTDLATMEAANEAARRAVNSIIDLSGVKAPLCKIWTVHEPELFAFWREQDRRRFANGLPWKEGFLLIELSSPSFWFHLFRHLYVRLRTKMRKWRLGR